MSDVDRESKPAAGAILSDDQVKRLRVAIAVMSALLVIGIITLIARVIYLASARGEQAATAVALSQSPALQPEVKLPLPAGASLRAASLTGNRLVAHYSSVAGDGVVIVDLATGKVTSRVLVEVAR